jgi:hypothetical protein
VLVGVHVRVPVGVLVRVNGPESTFEKKRVRVVVRERACESELRSACERERVPTLACESSVCEI